MLQNITGVAQFIIGKTITRLNARNNNLHIEFSDNSKFEIEAHSTHTPLGILMGQYTPQECCIITITSDLSPNKLRKRKFYSLSTFKEGDVLVCDHYLIKEAYPYRIVNNLGVLIGSGVNGITSEEFNRSGFLFAKIGTIQNNPKTYITIGELKKGVNYFD